MCIRPLFSGCPDDKVKRDHVRAFFHSAICCSLHIPGMLAYPPACGAIKVASVMSSVPGTLLR